MALHGVWSSHVGDEDSVDHQLAVLSPVWVGRKRSLPRLSETLRDVVQILDRRIFLLFCSTAFGFGFFLCLSLHYVCLFPEGLGFRQGLLCFLLVVLTSETKSPLGE